MIVLQDSASGNTFNIIPRNFSGASAYGTLTINIKEDGTNSTQSVTEPSLSYAINSNNISVTLPDLTSYLREGFGYSFELYEGLNLIYRDKLSVMLADGEAYDDSIKESIHEDTAGVTDYKENTDSNDEFIILN
jgi:hypothetical protein